MNNPLLGLSPAPYQVPKAAAQLTGLPPCSPRLLPRSPSHPPIEQAYDCIGSIQPPSSIALTPGLQGINWGLPGCSPLIGAPAGLGPPTPPVPIFSGTTTPIYIDAVTVSTPRFFTCNQLRHVFKAPVPLNRRGTFNFLWRTPSKVKAPNRINFSCPRPCELKPWL